MRGLGLSCNLVSGRPSIVGVIAERDGNRLIGGQVFRHLSDGHDDFPLQLVALHRALESELPDLKADAVVMRSMDWSRFVKSGEAQKKYAVEGVVLAVARHYVKLTVALDGREIGRRLGVTKETAEAEAAARLSNQKLKEAGAAAVAALVAAEKA